MKTNKLNKKEKIMKWASDKRNRSFSKMKKELNFTDDKQLMFHLNRMARTGLVRFKVVGRRVQFNLSREGYYTRSYFVPSV